MARDDRYMEKAELAMLDIEPPMSSADERMKIVAAATPIEHATSSVTIAGSALKANALATFVLGVLVAFLALRRLSREDDEI